MRSLQHIDQHSASAVTLMKKAYTFLEHALRTFAILDIKTELYVKWSFLVPPHTYQETESNYYNKDLNVGHICSIAEYIHDVSK
jgi:hypothetical protein